MLTRTSFRIQGKVEDLAFITNAKVKDTVYPQGLFEDFYRLGVSSLIALFY